MAQQQRVNESTEVVADLELVSEHMAHDPADPIHAKWIILALHSALEGFMILALRGRNGLNLLTEASARERIAAYERKDGQFPEPKIDTFAHLFKKIQSDRMITYVLSAPFVPNGAQSKSVAALDRLHGACTRFLPKDAPVDLSPLSLIIADCCDVISFLAFDCGNVAWSNPEEESKTKALLDQIRQRNAGASHSPDQG